MAERAPAAPPPGQGATARLALLVLGGEDLARRPRSRAALAHYRRALAAGQEPPLLVVSGAGPFEAPAMARFLAERGVAPDHLVEEPRARTTLQNIVLGGALARRCGAARVGLVSEAFHLPRARRLYALAWGEAPALCLASGAGGPWRLRLREPALLLLQGAALLLLGGPVAPARQSGRWAGKKLPFL